MLDYPSPRYPRLKRPQSVEELMPKARELVKQPWDVTYNSLRPAYGIKSGDKVLFVVLSEYDPMVITAMCRAMREEGARVDLHVIDSTPLGPPRKIAVHEAIAFDKDEGTFNYYYTLITDLIRTDTAKALIELERYDLVIAGMAGPPPSVSVPWKRFDFAALEDFVGPVIDFPMELMRLIDDKAFAQIMSCKTLRLTDPEGTDIRWTNYRDSRSLLSDHLFARPLTPGYGNNGQDDCTGVVAGTLNHLGAFPHCKAYVEGGQVVRVEGGGTYGDLWRSLLEKYTNVKLPPLSAPRLAGPLPSAEVVLPKYEVPAPGLFWYIECAVGTVPGVFRLPQEGRMECYGNMLHDRRRSGYIHNGFGSPIMGQRELIAAGLPWSHIHIHNMFGTLEGHTADGEAVRVIDKGHLTALDDPEVRAVASKFGDPDELLREAWIPGVPGINVPGDYMNDYGQDPVAWMKKEADEHPVWL